MRQRSNGLPWRFPAVLVGLLSVFHGIGQAGAQTVVLIEDYEFASTDFAARQGVVDLTSPANRPAFYISGDNDDGPFTGASQGDFSIGTDAVFCVNFQLQCIPGLFIGFRRNVSTTRFPAVCGGNARHYHPLQHTYGDPAHPGPTAPDFPLSELQVLGDYYGDGEFAGGLTGTAMIVRLVDCEGEIFEFTNLDEEALYFEPWSLDVVMGRSQIRLLPQSLTDVPNGDRMLTEISATEAIIRDDDNPPTSTGKWYIDNLRIVEPAVVTSGACCVGATCSAAASQTECHARAFVCDVETNVLPECDGPCGVTCFGDANGDGFVTAADRGFVAVNIGRTELPLVCQYDMDGNGFINAGDRGYVAASVGACHPLPDYMNGSGLNNGAPDARFAQPVFHLGQGCASVTCE